jgi:stage II sporulation protein D
VLFLKRIFLISLVLIAVVFLLPFLSMPDAPLIILGQAGQPSRPPEKPEPAPAATAASISALATVTSEPPPVPAVPADRDAVLTVRVDGRNVSLALDEYLWGVLAGELPPTFPPEALKAQAVAARTFAMYKLEHPPEDGRHPGAALCDDPAHCQVYLPRGEAMAQWGNSGESYAAALDKALSETDGLIMAFDGHPIMAAYHSTSSGKTERAADVWGQDVPYLQSVDSPGERDAPRYQARSEVTKDEFWNALRALYPDIAESETPIGTVTRSKAGGVLSIEISGTPVTGPDIRRLFSLNSTNFTAALVGDTFRFDTLGYGHGVGLSQYGARAMALEGRSCADILRWYYPGAELAGYDTDTKTVLIFKNPI